MILLTWAEFSLTNVASWSLPVRICAVVAAFGVGAIGSGLLVQFLTKSATRQTAPGPAVNLVRVTGGLAAGLAAFLYLIGSGGYGPGGNGPGGDGPGDSSKNSLASKDDGKKDSTDQKKPEGTNNPKGTEETELRVEILSDKVLSESDIRKELFYRITSSDGEKLLSLEQLIQFIVDHKPYPSVVILIDYEDTADTDRLRATRELRRLAGDLKKNKEEWVKSEPKARKSPRP